MNDYVKEFNSIYELYRYLCDTPFNSVFSDFPRSSEKPTSYFSLTESYEEAVNLMLNGWQDMSKNITQKLKDIDIKNEEKVYKNTLSVYGYQPIVPLYLSGIPTNMVSKQLQKVKSKVINVTKMITYSSFTRPDEIMKESIKALCLVKKLESQGYRINLSVVFSTSDGKGTAITCKVKIKNANERLNISKVSFSLVHPSMLRRIMFRFIEVCPYTTKGFTDRYGYITGIEELKKILTKDIVIPAIWSKNIDSITSIDDII